MRIAGSYEWTDPADPLDAFDRFTREPDYWPTPDDDQSESRSRRPFTQAEFDDFFRRGGKITYCPTPRPEPRRRPRVSKARKRQLLQSATDFNPLAGVPDAVSVLEQHLDIIKPTSRRDMQMTIRAKNVIKAVLDGATFADAAVELGLDPGFLSRTLQNVYKRYPNLERPLWILNLLNLQEKRREPSSSLLSALVRGAEISEQFRPLLGPPPYAEKPSTVKLIELHQRVFAQLESNYGAMVDEMVNEAVNVGTQRVLRVAMPWNKSYFEADKIDYRAPLPSDSYDHDALDAWLRLRRAIDHAESFLDFIDAAGGYPPEEHLSWFFSKEDLRRVAVDCLPTRVKPPKRERDKPPSTPWSLSWRSPFVGAPSSNHGYLGPVGREIPRRPLPAPIPTNFYNRGCRLKIKLRPLSKLRGKGPRSKPFANAVLNHGIPNIDSELRRMFPEPPTAKITIKRLKHWTRSESTISAKPDASSSSTRPTVTSTAKVQHRYACGQP